MRFFSELQSENIQTSIIIIINTPIQGLSTIFKKAPGIQFIMNKSRYAENFEKSDWLFRKLGTKEH